MISVLLVKITSISGAAHESGGLRPKLRPGYAGAYVQAHCTIESEAAPVSNLASILIQARYVVAAYQEWMSLA